MVFSETTVVTSENTTESTIKQYGRHVVLFNVESMGVLIVTLSYAR
jgi:hypothetical protein